MNLAQITKFINDKIRNKTPKVIKIELADIQQEIVNEIYKTETYDTNLKGLIVNEIDANSRGLLYKILFKKVGKTVFFNGTIFNNNNIITSNFFPTIKIKNSEFFVVDSHDANDNIYDKSICINDSYKSGICSVFKDALSLETILSFDFENNNNISAIFLNGSYQTKN